MDRVAGVRWGFVGAGNVTRRLASPEAAFTQEGSQVVAVACSDPARARAFAATHGIARAHPDAETLCADPDVDAVYVCTPIHLHIDHALLAVRNGKHVLCEKPLERIRFSPIGPAVAPLRGSANHSALAGRGS